MTFGAEYASYYDEIHSNKNYEFEAAQLIELIRKSSLGGSSKILDFGCGTGKHMEKLLENGFDIDGFDISENMLSFAKKRLPRNTFYVNYSDIPKVYDLTYSLFDVLSYQISDSEVRNFLSKLSSVSNHGGKILIDSWHLSGLQNDPPTNRTKQFQLNGKELLRTVKVQGSEDLRISRLNISIENLENNELLLEENHTMRAFSREEMAKFISEIGGTDVEFFDGNEYSDPLSDNSWRIGAMFKVNKGID